MSLVNTAAVGALYLAWHVSEHQVKSQILLISSQRITEDDWDAPYGVY